MHGLFSAKNTKFAGLELIEKNKCLKNKTSEYKSEQQEKLGSALVRYTYHIL
jgi:hypothetical protein